ncbi:hypothetical protein BDB00DRAFT_800623 [Zychaea mexicana]|uniref:uncharacterized protein n=1 Tax=Zychaea mexicana TaxID=64656 RepID=UPI0022FE8799|nr:uncharacterized protein BDB00DRAFT_800623 [Zychaea mexicana]KAI9498517.1 hypothetical protein BDB00DRAFT_800623 [Zychaea mexicana]
MEHHDDDDDDLDNNNNNNNNICNETNDNANSYSNRHETLMDNEPPTMDGHVSKQFGEPVEGEEEEEEDQTVEEQPSPKPLCNNGEKGKETIRINPEDYTSSIEKDLSIHDVAEECTTVLSYQSLADIIPLPPPSTTPAHLPPPATAATTTTASSYGSTVAERSLHRHHYQHQQRLLSHQHLRQQQRENKNDLAQRLLQYPILRSSDRLANAVLEAFELAEELASSKASFFGFLLYFVRIWQVLFLCAESLISIRRRSPLPPFHREPRKVSSNDEMV